MKVKVLKSFYDPETEKRGIVGEVIDISQSYYNRAKNLFEVKKIIARNTKSTVEVKANKTRKRRKK